MLSQGKVNMQNVIILMLICTLLQVGGNYIVRDETLRHLGKCQLKLGSYSHNPLTAWLQAQEKEDYPKFSIASDQVTVDWGLADSFKCLTDPTVFEMKTQKLQMTAINRNIGAKDETRKSKFSPTVFTNLNTNVGDIDLRCLPWKMTVGLTMEMLKFKGKTNLTN